MKSSQTILICLLVRNAEKNIKTQFAQFCKAFSGFENLSFYFVESDSTDRTLKILESLSRQDCRVKYITLGRLEEKIPNRVERIRECRNTYVNFIRENPSKFEYVVVADFDGINSKLNSRGVNSAFESEVSWDMCSANQKYGYYDIYALRAQGWCDSDYQLEMEEKSKGLSPRQLFQLRTQLIYDRMKKISRKSAWIPVDSAFGGLAVYKTDMFLRADYAPIDINAYRQCEHVDFNLKLKKMGYHLFINPALINSHWNTYNINRFKVIRRIRGFKRRIRG